MQESQGLSIIRKCKTVCRECGDPCEGIVGPSGKPMGVVCDKCTNRREGSELAEWAVRNADARVRQLGKLDDLLRGYCGVNRRYVNCSLENFDGQFPIKAPCFITGPVGTGKTHLAVGYFRQHIINRINSEPENGWYMAPQVTAQDGRVVRAVDLFKEIRDCFRENSENTESQLLDDYGNTKLLVIDDLGTEKVTDFVEQTLYDIIDHRYAEELPIIITSNLSISKLAAHYKNHGDRLASRICGMGEVYEIKAKDRRLTQYDARAC